LGNLGLKTYLVFERGGIVRIRREGLFLNSCPLFPRCSAGGHARFPLQTRYDAA